MKPDVDYLKKLLQAFRDATKPTTNIEELKMAGLDYKQDPQFEFHLRILVDDQYVENDDGSRDIGFRRSVDGYASWGSVPLRLTSSGHEFAAALCEQSVFENVKAKVLPASLKTISAVAGAFLKAEISKRVGLSI
ncbi:MAG: hypothetical protein ABSE99_01880 [Terracidiphilus sp.]|jgi:hypothetical protein